MQYFYAYFVRSGYLHLSYKALKSLGSDGSAWSNTSKLYSTAFIANAYVFGFNQAGTDPSSGPWERWLGRPVRCLVILVA